MALRFLRAVDLFDYTELLKALYATGNAAPAVITGSPDTWPRFDGSRGRIVSSFHTASGLTAGSGGSMDFLLVDTSSAKASIVEGSRQIANATLGYYDLTTQARLYGTQVSATAFEEISQVDFSSTPGAFGTNPPNTDGSNVGVTNEGSFSAGSARSWLIFEGMTEGVPGETLLTGPNVYPEGLGLVQIDTGWVDGSVFGAPFLPNAANNANNLVAWVDLEEGEVVGGLLNTPGTADSGESLFAEPSIAGRTFRWRVGQFIPDIDSSPAAPKGELMLMAGGINDDPEEIYVRFIDFNPLGVVTAGAPSRTHEQINLTSRLDIPLGPLWDLSGADWGNAGFEGQLDDGAVSVLYNPEVGQLALITTKNSTSVNAIERAAIGFYSRAVEIASIGTPVAVEEPETNTVTEFVNYTRGNLGEPAANIVVDFTLQAGSTLGEVVTVSGGVATTSQLARFPLDEAPPSGNPGLVLVATTGGVPSTLVEATDYTVDYATGEITWVTDQSGADTVAAEYFHTTDPNPNASHGTLLSAQAVTDALGRSTTRIRTPTSILFAGHIDVLVSDSASAPAGVT